MMIMMMMIWASSLSSKGILNWLSHDDNIDGTGYNVRRIIERAEESAEKGGHDGGGGIVAEAM